MTALDLTAIRDAAGIWSGHTLPEPTIRGQWATWEQTESRPATERHVKSLKAAGYAAFFSPSDRRWGIKVPA